MTTPIRTPLSAGQARHQAFAASDPHGPYGRLAARIFSDIEGAVASGQGFVTVPLDEGGGPPSLVATANLLQTLGGLGYRAIRVDRRGQPVPGSSAYALNISWAG